MLPAVGLSNPASRRMMVLLPQPEGPIITVSLPDSTVNEQSRTTLFANVPEPYDLFTFFATILPAAGEDSRPGADAELLDTCGVIVIVASMSSLVAQPRRRQLSSFAYQRAGNVAGNADADHADDDLRVGSADI